MSPSISPTHFFGDLPLLKLHLTWTTAADASLPPFLGSAWRGLAGWELRRLVCPFSGRHNCEGCVIGDHCPYFLLFEKKSSMPGLADAPRGYIFHAQPFTPGKIMEMNVTLLGNCTRFFPALRHCLLRARTSGLGASRTPFEILTMELVLPSNQRVPLSLDPEDHPIPPEPSPLREWVGDAQSESTQSQLEFLTPLRLRRQGKYLADFDLHFFFMSLTRRMEALNVIFNGGSPLGSDNWKVLSAYFSASATVKGNLHWKDQSRYSNRQKTRVPQGGLVGKLCLDIAEPSLAHWLAAAELLHVGKGASMGLGRVKKTFIPQDASFARKEQGIITNRAMKTPVHKIQVR